MRKRTTAVLVALASVAVALVVALPASAAGNAGPTQVSTFNPTGAVFTCPGTNYTVLGGTVTSVLHDSFAANGSEHVTGTIAPTGVTLTDGTTTVPGARRKQAVLDRALSGGRAALSSRSTSRMGG